MGQSSSRHHDPPKSSPLNPTPNGVASSSSAPQQEHSPEVDSNSPGSRRSSVRRSILRLVNPQNVRNRLSRIPSKSWRNSRRWSKTPVTASTLSGLRNTSSSSVLDESSRASPIIKDKGKQRDVVGVLDEEATVTPASIVDRKAADMVLPDETSPSTGSSLGETTTGNMSSLLEPAQASLPETISIETDEREAQALSPPHSPSQQTTIPQPVQSPRQFPPPGTLVVVQGIVHTTDVSRPNNSFSTPASPVEEPPSSNGILPTTNSESSSESSSIRARNRLSNLLRPRSLSSRPSSTILNESVTSTAGIEGIDIEASPETQLLSSSSSHREADATVSSPDEPSPMPESSEEAPVDSGPANDAHSPLISSNSIDVLATLLSVAAAATAASLLTGSSEPILSSGLAPPSIPSSSPAGNSSPHPRLSTPTPIPNGGTPDNMAGGRAERMRQAWGSIRERLGLRPSGNGTSSNDGPDEAAPGSLADTREIMLAEMARAFNIGLGLNGPGNTQNRSPADRGAGVPSTEDHVANDNAEVENNPEAHRPEGTHRPAEGSFERFLVDLQSDLRMALTRPTTTPNPEQGHSLESLSSPDGTSGTIENFTNNIHSSSNPSTSGISLSNEVSSSTNIEHVSPPVAGEVPEMPMLEVLSNSESEADDNEMEVNGTEHDEFQSASPSLRDESEQNEATETSRSGADRIDASGRINWWRLYRFPPIMSSRVDASNIRQHPFAASPSVPITTASPTSEGSTPLQSTTENSAPTASAEIPTTPSYPNDDSRPPQAAPHSVVPVIVVGLQSVNQEWGVDITGPAEGDLFNAPSDELTGEDSITENSEDHSVEAHQPQYTPANPLGRHAHGTRGIGRGRGWHSRAANVIRNLRPSSRRNGDNSSDNQTTAVLPASRTFLIYVIGGYYPPDHSIVTGGPNILDSFEALLELADLLGQVKPPTVSKDDIEKSGLKIIKASELSQYENDGKVASNCLDRCLICLDDYEDEDPIRVMSCRHAFHKACVDEWLQKGRNNCPACRSTGVNADTHSAVPVSGPSDMEGNIV